MVDERKQYRTGKFIFNIGNASSENIGNASTVGPTVQLVCLDRK